MVRPFAQLLGIVGSCCVKFETGQTFEPTTPNISFVSWSPKRGTTMLDPFAQLFQYCWGHASALHMVSLQSQIDCIPFTMRCRSQYCWELLHPFAKRKKFSCTNQKPERRWPFGTGLIRHCPQGLFSPFFTFLRAIFSHPFRVSLASIICPWVSEDVMGPPSTHTSSVPSKNLSLFSSELYRNNF